MRDIETIDCELRLVTALRRAAQERGGPLPSIDVGDALLDERHELTEWATTHYDGMHVSPPTARSHLPLHSRWQSWVCAVRYPAKRMDEREDVLNSVELRWRPGEHQAAFT
jgi:hypothetical protein